MSNELKSTGKRQKAKAILISLVLMITSFATLAITAPVSAQLSQSSKNAACEGISSTTGGQCGTDSAGSLNNVIAAILNLLSVVVGIIAVVMIIVGALKFITSGGDSQKVASARSTILYAVIGLVIVALAQVIVRFVLNKAV